MDDSSYTPRDFKPLAGHTPQHQDLNHHQPGSDPTAGRDPSSEFGLEANAPIWSHEPAPNNEKLTHSAVSDSAQPIVQASSSAPSEKFCPPIGPHETSAAPTDARPPARQANTTGPVRDQGAQAVNRLTWLLSLLAMLMLLTYFVPFLVERIQFAAARGRQRGEYEVAKRALREFPAAHLSNISEMVTKQIAPSVVHINVGNVRSAAFRPSDSRSPAVGQGSGVIIDQDGYILTNRHVVHESIQSNRGIEVKLSDGRRTQAIVVAADTMTDLAILKINASKLIPAEWGDSENLSEGSFVWAVGSPFGLERSVTFGIVSGKDRGAGSDTPYTDYLQTDAAVNPGNSGGPLVNHLGQVVGINTAIIGESFQGISFAIPSRLAKQIYEELKSKQKVERGYLGVMPVDVPSDLAFSLGLESTSGALVQHVSAGTPAKAAGVQPGDIILSWNGVEVRNSNHLFRMVAKTLAGDVIDMELNRNGKKVAVQVIVEARVDLQ